MQEGFGLDPRISVAVLGVTCFATIFGGLKRISAVMEKIVPFMALLYILGGMGILLIHLADVPKAFWLILESAFTPTAAVGGFAGATVKDALRYGIAGGFIPMMPELDMASLPMLRPVRIILCGRLHGGGGKSFSIQSWSAA